MKFKPNILNKYVKNSAVCCEKHPNSDLFLYGYYTDYDSQTPIIWDKVSIHCRGLIVNEKGDIVERPFPKFWTYLQYLSADTLLLTENRIVKIPKGKFRILEKVDGTMVILYWIDNKPYLATQRSFTNIKAIEATKILHTKYSHLFNKFNKKYTYIFEAIYPETNVLINYGNRRDLILIGVIDKETGQIQDLPDIGFPRCKDYTQEYSHINNFDELVQLNLPNQEGFVIYFQNGLMIKLKFPWYQKAHKILDKFLQMDKQHYIIYKEMNKILEIKRAIVSTMDVWQALSSGDQALFSIRQSVPNFYYLMGFEYWLNETKQAFLKELEDYPSKSWYDIKPKIIQFFNFEERMKKPHIFETIVWKWKERYLKY